MRTISDLNDDYSNLDEVLDSYSSILDDIENNIEISGKTVAEANKEQPTLMVKCYQCYNDLKYLKRIIDNSVTVQRSKTWKAYKEKYSLDLGARDLEQYVSGDKSVVLKERLSIEVGYYLDRASGILKTLENRGFALKNITEAIIANVDNMEI
jgi:hypothetical protein